jgi:hypothetical protein
MLTDSCGRSANEGLPGRSLYLKGGLFHPTQQHLGMNNVAFPSFSYLSRKHVVFESAIKHRLMVRSLNTLLVPLVTSVVDKRVC